MIHRLASRFTALAALAALAFTSCAHVKTSYVITDPEAAPVERGYGARRDGNYQSAFSPAYMAHKGDVPDRPYKTFAELSAQGNDAAQHHNVVSALSKRAYTLGADAVLITERSGAASEPGQEASQTAVSAKGVAVIWTTDE